MGSKLNGEFTGAGIYSILRLVPVGIIILEKSSGKITYANDHAVELYGANPIGVEVPNHSTKTSKHTSQPLKTPKHTTKQNQKTSYTIQTSPCIKRT